MTPAFNSMNARAYASVPQSSVIARSRSMYSGPAPHGKSGAFVARGTGLNHTSELTRSG